MTTAQSFAERVIEWQQEHGRHHLPWQHAPGAPNAAYRVWVSEIMLQQTQVAVAVPYFERWMGSFPTVAVLAAASQDSVLEHWAGLGYYARARNLHRAAQQLVAEHAGKIPSEQAALETLPGIGRSTAAAIRSLAFGQPAAILDGNVKRVIARHDAIGGWPGTSSVLKALWESAESRVSSQLTSTEAASYSQGMMDLGATLCSKREPTCLLCPVNADCAAKIAGTQSNYPAPKPKKTIPIKHTRVLYAKDEQGRLLLQRRPSSGVWGGLWSLPEIPASPEDTLQTLGLKAVSMPPSSTEIRHQLTHFTWNITPVRAIVTATALCDDDRSLWWSPGDPLPALPAPIERYLTAALTEPKHTP